MARRVPMFTLIGGSRPLRGIELGELRDGTLEGEESPAPPTYTVNVRSSLIGAAWAVVVWAVIVGSCGLINHMWPWPVAVICGYTLLPIGLAVGVRRTV